MRKQKKLSDLAKLRLEAEEMINRMSPVKSALSSWMSEPDALKLIHELQVHQIELELQNEELRLAKEQSEIAINEYSELFEFAPSGYFILSETGKIIELNLNGSQMLGKGRQYLKNSPFIFFVSDDTKKIFSDFLKKVFEGKTKEMCEITLSIPDSLQYVHLTGTILENRDLCLVNVADISSQISAFKALETSMYKKNLLQEVAGEGIVGIDKDGNITFLDRKAEEILGYKSEKLKGKNFRDLFLI